MFIDYQYKIKPIKICVDPIQSVCLEVYTHSIWPSQLILMNSNVITPISMTTTYEWNLVSRLQPVCIKHVSETNILQTKPLTKSYPVMIMQMCNLEIILYYLKRRAACFRSDISLMTVNLITNICLYILYTY